MASDYPLGIFKLIRQVLICFCALFFLCFFIIACFSFVFLTLLSLFLFDFVLYLAYVSGLSISHCVSFHNPDLSHSSLLQCLLQE